MGAPVIYTVFKIIIDNLIPPCDKANPGCEESALQGDNYNLKVKIML